jgi:hypothetical protein
MIWGDFKQQPDRASCEAALSAFFATLAKQDTSLTHFSNQALCDGIIHHRFFRPGGIM